MNRKRIKMKRYVENQLLRCLLLLGGLMTICLSIFAVTQVIYAEEVETKTVVDMRGKEVEIPQEPERVVVIDKGFVLQTMVALNLKDKIVGTGGLINVSKVEERDSILLLNNIYDLPNVGYPTDAVDFENLTSVEPDLIIWRNSEYIFESEISIKAIKTIEEELKIPIVVVNGPGCYEEVELEKYYEGINLIAEVFNKQERGNEIVTYLQDQINFIQEKTKDIPDEDKPSVMFMGLLADKEVGVVWGEDTGDAKFSREYANIKNVYSEKTRMKMSAEQLIKLNPEVIVLCTNSVRPYPEIFKEEQYSNLQAINAIKNERVVSLGELTWWGDFRLEFPTILLISAKAAYPEHFKDVNVNEWLDKHHKLLFNLSDSELEEIKRVQGLEWLENY